MKKRESWNLVNLTSRTISSGFPNVRAIGPGKSTDLLATISKDDVRSSRGIAYLLQHGWARIDKVIDDVVMVVVNADNISGLQDNSGGSADVVVTPNTPVDPNSGQAVPDTSADDGAIAINSEVSLSAAGTVISANCTELVTAADFTVTGVAHMLDETLIHLPKILPVLQDNSMYTFAQNGTKLVLVARNKDGKVVHVDLADFSTDSI